MSDRIIESLEGRWEEEKGWGTFEFAVSLNKDRWTTQSQTIEGIGELMVSHLDEGYVSKWGIEFTYPRHGCQGERESAWSRLGGRGIVREGIVWICDRKQSVQDVGRR